MYWRLIRKEDDSHSIALQFKHVLHRPTSRPCQQSIAILVPTFREKRLVDLYSFHNPLQPFAPGQHRYGFGDCLDHDPLVHESIRSMEPYLVPTGPPYFPIDVYHRVVVVFCESPPEECHEPPDVRAKRADEYTRAR